MCSLFSDAESAPEMSSGLESPKFQQPEIQTEQKELEDLAGDVITSDSDNDDDDDDDLDDDDDAHDLDGDDFHDEDHRSEVFCFSAYTKVCGKKQCSFRIFIFTCFWIVSGRCGSTSMESF